MIIKNIKYRVNADQRGKITTGIKSEKGYPSSTDYFVISDFTELVTAYGEKPNKLVLYFPSDTIEDFYNSCYSLYGSNKEQIRRCDGEMCLHRIKESYGKYSFNAGEENVCVCNNGDVPMPENKKCRYVMHLKAFICLPSGKVENTSCYLFETHSKNSGDNIYSEIEKAKTIFGKLRTVPFLLSVKMVGGKDDAKKKFPIWNLQVLGMVSQVKELQEKNGFLEGNNIKSLLGSGEIDIDNIIKSIEVSDLEMLKQIFKNSQTLYDEKKITEKTLETIREICNARREKLKGV